MSPTVVAEQRVIAVTAETIVQPGRKAKPPVTRIEVIAEVVTVESRSNKETAKQKVIVNHKARPEKPRGDTPERSLEVNRSEEQAAAVKLEVPIAFHKHVAGRRPDVMRWNPDPPRPVVHPVAGSPNVAGLTVDPVAGDEDAVRGRLRLGGRSIQRGRRRRQIFKLFLFHDRPEAR
jgi:hypothetical protein